MVQVEECGFDVLLVWVVGENWYSGVVGIVVSCLKEVINCFVIVIGFDEDGIGKGFGCFVSGIDFGVFIQWFVFEGFLVKGGGYKMVVGFIVECDKFEFVMICLLELFVQQGVDCIGFLDFKFDGMFMSGVVFIDFVN